MSGSARRSTSTDVFDFQKTRLRGALEDIHAGRLKLPSFQRGWKWSDSMLRPESGQEAVRTIQWTLLLAAHLGPTMGQLSHFRAHIKHEPCYALERQRCEAVRLLGMLDHELARRAYLAGGR